MVGDAVNADPVARGAGRVLAIAVAGLARLRPADKPMHPRGEVCVATLRRRGGPVVGGASFLDDAGDDQVLVRFSRSVGLPEPLPDVNGLALRVPTPDGRHADVLFSTTGRGRFSRYALATSTRPRGGFFGTLLPYRTPGGPVHLGARAVGGGCWELVWARAGGAWNAFASLTLAEPSDQPGSDLTMSFDAVQSAPAGLEVYRWHRLVRGPSYAAARRARNRG